MNNKDTMDREKKQKLLLCVVKDFLLRRERIQYDQRSMDRMLELTPRRRKFLPPEAGTSDYTLYLDCSGFCFDVYYQAFGYELEADLTWHMADMLEPRVYYYEKTFCETESEKASIAKQIENCLEIGDLIVLQHRGHSGHVMLYMGNGEYAHCRPESSARDDSYDYETGENHDVISGALSVDKLCTLLYPLEDGSYDRYYLFSEKETRIAIARPLDRAGMPTEQALARAGAYDGLWTEVRTSRFGGRTAAAGEEIRYTLVIRNTLNEPKEVVICCRGGEDGCGEITGTAESQSISIRLEPKEERVFSFIENAEPADEFYHATPEIRVNNLSMYIYPVMVGKTATAMEQRKLTECIESLLAGDMEVMEAAQKAYEAYGIDLEPSPRKNIISLFYLHDSKAGDVLSRKKQRPEKDLALYSYFGGRGVITPQMCMDCSERTTRIRLRDLMPGDIILCCDDACGKKSYAALFTGDKIIGNLDAEAEIKSIGGQEAERYIDGLFAKFCFIIIRPWLGKE